MPAKQTSVQPEQDQKLPSADQPQPDVQGGSTTQDQPEQQDQDTASISPQVMGQGTPLVVPGPVPQVPVEPEKVTFLVNGQIVDPNGVVVGTLLP